MYHLGIDLYKHESHVAVSGDRAEVVEEIRVTNASLDDVTEEYAGAQAALEATSNYCIGYATLDKPLDVVVVDAAQTKGISYAEVKNDRLDATLLAQLRRAGIIPESYAPFGELRKRRVLVRRRKRLVERRTEFKNEVHALLGEYGTTYDWDPFSVKGRETLAGESFSLGASAIS